jgi:hypothetical protein
MDRGIIIRAECSRYSVATASLLTVYVVCRECRWLPLSMNMNKLPLFAVLFVVRNFKKESDRIVT